MKILIKLMIVDDEAIFRDYLCTLLPWDEYGMKITIVAKNGKDALVQAEAAIPHIALIDINMPFMDGLQLSEELKKLSPDIGIVLVTGHNEFEYARKALKLGVQDYILKPFSKEELLLTLLNIQENMLKVQEDKETHQASKMMMREVYLNRLVNGELEDSEDKLMEQLRDLGYAPMSGMFQVAVIEIDNMNARWRHISDRELWKFAVTNILSETLDIPGNHIVFNGSEGRIVCIYEVGDHGVQGFSGAAGQAVSPSPPLAAYVEGCKQLKFLIRKYLKFTVTIGVGRIHSGYAQIKQSYQEALLALQNKFVVGQDQVIDYGTQAAITGKTAGGFLAPHMSESLLVGMRSGDWDSVKRQLEDIFDGLEQERMPIDYVFVICMSLVSLCLSCVSENGHPIEDCFGEDFYPYSEIVTKPTIEEAGTWLIHLFNKANRYTQLHKKTKSGKIAETAKAWIDQHYTDPELKVEQIAQSVFINPSYLRAIFKKMNGMTVTDYILQKRMQHAKSLLSASKPLRLADIAEAIGYHDPAYFSRAFKKYYGYSPSEFENLPRA
ncbi:response regulator [Paenibacillus lemnae]|uniref:Response regulator n=1 Tax=Paenibacillus lemnae TaxID=1330551 RepID=A0A848M543_PAELE|nr:response regulator [Paenibacillus lemnae]NMO94903.1 response regulator [Paenibacillus lemnae]